MGVRRYDRFDNPDRAAGGGPLALQLDRGVALSGYGLLFASLFTVGLSAFAAYALAAAHRNDSHLIVRTHYLHQMRLVRTGVFSAVLAVLCGVAALLLGVSKLFGWAEVDIPWATQAIGSISLPADRLATAGWIAAAGLVLLLYGVVHTAIGCAWGALKLVAGRPIGDIDED